MLVARRALGPMLRRPRAAPPTPAPALAAAHRDTAARRPHAAPAGAADDLRAEGGRLAVGLDEARRRARRRARARLAVQLGGAAGTLPSLGDDGLAVRGGSPRELGLAEPALPWHTDRARRRDARRARSACGGRARPRSRATSSLLAQTEVGEAAEGGAGRAARRRCPTSATRSAAIARGRLRAARAPALVATCWPRWRSEHERAAGAWHAEWETLRELLRLVGSARGVAAECARGARSIAARMRANLDLTDGLLDGRERDHGGCAGARARGAHELVEQACRRAVDERRALRDVLRETPASPSTSARTSIDAALGARALSRRGGHADRPGAGSPRRG